jgi:hypothetical protein
MLAMVACARVRARTMPFKSPLTKVMPALSTATSAPVPMAMPTSAAGKSRRVIDAVAGHRDFCALGAQLVDQLQLGVGQHVGAHLVDAKF